MLAASAWADQMLCLAALVTNGASSEGEFGDAHLGGISIKMALMKEGEQEIEHGDHGGQARVDRGRNAMADALEIADDGEHGE